MEWISVKERLPENNTIVLGFGKSMLRDKPDVIAVMKCIVLRGNWLDQKGYFIDEHLNITHWMPLTEPPERK